MPEHDKEKRFEGEASGSRSSDAFIEGTLRSLQAEMEGTTDNVVSIPSSDIYGPKLLTSRVVVQEVEAEPTQAQTIEVDPALSHRSSLCALQIRNRRQLKISQKAA